jgi:tetratricopeptide (TPR) repeat protein
MKRHGAAFACAALLTAQAPLPQQPQTVGHPSFSVCRNHTLPAETRVQTCRALLDSDQAGERAAATHSALGVALAQQGKFEDARREADQAVALEPKVWQIWSNRGQVLAASRDYQAALDNDSKAIAQWPGQAALFLQRGSVYLAMDRLDDALADLDRSIDLDPNDIYSTEVRITIYLRLRRYDDAIGKLKAVDALEEDAGGAANERCWVRAVADRELDTALADCNTALAAAPAKSNRFDSRALVHFRRTEFQDALADYDAALKGDAKSPSTLYARGVTRLRLGDAKGGRADIDAATKLDGDVATAMAELNVAP